MNRYLRTRDLVLDLAGVLVLLMKGWFRGSIGDLAHSYLGNLAVSFSVYFLVSFAVAPRLGRLGIAAIALIVVEAFEITDGFGIMSNVHDPFDYLANALGVALAWLVDIVSTRAIQVMTRRA